VFICDLHQPLPESFRLIPRRRILKGCSFDFFNIGNKVHLVGPFVRVPIDELGNNVDDRKENQGKVACNKGVDSPFSLEEYGPSAQEADENACNHCVPGSEGLDLGVERKIFTVDILGLETGVESKIGQANAKPGHQTCYSGHVGEPVKDFIGTG